MPKIDFGLQIEPQYGFTYDTIRKLAELCESVGFESIWVSDHFFMTEDSINTPCLDCWTILSALARDTKKLRLGPMVTAQSYRNPALLAKIATSVDNISNGRLYFGIGAGWKEVEYRAYGYPYPKPSVRIKQLDEAIQIAKRMWTENKPIFKGRYYDINGALCFPKPIQRPYIPIWIGGTGDLLLKIVAKHAQGCNFSWRTPEQFEERLEMLRRHCSNLGRDYNSIRKSAALMITMAPTEHNLARKLDEQARKKDTPYMRYLDRQPPNLVGTPEQVAESIRRYIPLGVDHFILRFHFGDEIESIALFMDEVKKQL